MPDPLLTGSLQSFASLVDDAALRFEEAWEADPASPPDLESFLPPDPAARDRAALRLAQVDLERRTAAGFTPLAEAYLARFPTLAADPEDVFALALTEAEARLRHGRPCDPDDYRRRFPALVDRLITRLLHRSLPRVPGYEILGELGRGGMGVVYKARQVKLNRVVALKVVTAPDRKSVTRFLLEAEAVAAVRHPHVIEVFDSGEYADLPYLAMEYLDGGSLKDVLKRSPGGLLPADAASLVAAVAGGVHAVHEAGIVHRDLKPANVLLASGGREPPEGTPSGGSRPPLARPKVSDFGLALRGGVELTQTQGKFLGTPAYAAPEQAAGRREFVGPPADVWALGVILYECLAGSRPFDGDDPLSVLNAVQTKTAEPVRARNPGVPRDLELICLKCLEKEPRDRYPSAAALADDLRRYLDGKPVTVRPVGALVQAVKWVRRNPVPAALIAAVLVGSAGTTAAALVARENAREAAAAESRRLEAANGQLEAERKAAEAVQRTLSAERERAAEKESRGRAEREAAVAAALQANDLQRVVDVVAAAERDGLPVPAERRFAAAAALAALDRVPEAQVKLEALLTAPELAPDLKARVELYLADSLYGEDDARAKELLAAARASGRLSPADLAYADAVEAGTMTAGIARLRDAVRHDPQHFPARRMLGLCLFTTGDLDDAIRVGEVSRMLARNHPEILWSLFFSYGFKGDAARTREMFALLRPHLPPDLARQFEMLAKYLPAINAQFRASISGGPEPLGELYGELAREGGANSVMSPLRATDTIKASVLRRMPPTFRDALDDYLEFSYATAAPGGDYSAELQRDEVKLARLKANMERRPEGFMLFVYSVTLTNRAFGYLNRYGKSPPHMNRFREMCLIAADAYRRAAECPGLIDVRSVALEGAAMHYSLAARPVWVPESGADRGSYAKAAEMVRRRLAMAEPVGRDRIEVLTRVCRHARDYTTARRLLDEWERRDPDDPSASASRAEVELRAGSHATALAAARKVPVGHPAHARMQEIEGECLSKLRRDPALPPESAPPPRPVPGPSVVPGAGRAG